MFLLQAQVTSSDALKNAPFILLCTCASGAPVKFTPSDTFAKSYATKGGKSNVNVIKIPKSTLGFVKVGKYMLKERVSHMPLVRALDSPSCKWKTSHMQLLLATRTQSI